MVVIWSVPLFYSQALHDNSQVALARNLLEACVLAMQMDAKRMKPAEQQAPLQQRQPLAPRLPNAPAHPSSSATAHKPAAAQQQAAAAQPPAAQAGSGSLRVKPLVQPSDVARPKPAVLWPGGDAQPAVAAQTAATPVTATPRQVRC